jgi:DNA-dependent RNA polymerase auxiliary subunit epsilon
MQKYIDHINFNEKANQALSGKFHHVMRRNFFKDLSDAELREKNNALYLKFDNAREIRRTVMHARVKQIEEIESLQAINNVREVIKHILDNQEDMKKWILQKY